jgi:O-antigen/teichoic acid export membrane protein
VLAIGHSFDNTFFWNRVALLALGRPIFPTAVNLIGMLLKVGMVFYLVPRFGAIAFAEILAGYFIFTVGVSASRVVLDVYRRLSPVSSLEAAV